MSEPSATLLRRYLVATPNNCQRHLRHKNTSVVELLGKSRNNLDRKDRSVIASSVDPHSSVLDDALFIVHVLMS